ncbi:MAG: D-alanyl-D-alanine carboxypeptidase [Pseudomonadota bacterium]
MGRAVLQKCGRRAGKSRGLHASSALIAVGVALAAQATFPGSAQAASKHAALVLDAKTGRVLHASNADASRYPASLTKMMTLYVVFDMIKAKRVSLDSKLVITKRAAGQQPSKLGLRAGSRITMRDAIRALVTKSANDVATAVAENLAGTEAKFARYMTWRARQLGMLKTTFKNASGLTARGQKTTARDMATLGLRLAEDHPKLFKFFKTRYFKHGKRRYKNFNSLLFNYAGTEGIKTGYTRASGFNLVTSVRKDRRHVIAVVMGGKTARKRDSTMRKLLRANVKRASRTRTRRTVPKPQLVARAQKPNVRPKRVAKAQRAVRKIKTRKFAGLSNNAGAIAKRRSVTQVASRGDTANDATERMISATATGTGRYHVQVGSHTNETSAKRQLRDVLQRASELVDGHPPVTVPFDRGATRWYRARFAGFSKQAARSACASLKDRKIDCLVMAAQ